MKAMKCVVKHTSLITKRPEGPGAMLFLRGGADCFGRMRHHSISSSSFSWAPAGIRGHDQSCTCKEPPLLRVLSLWHNITAVLTCSFAPLSPFSVVKEGNRHGMMS